MFLRQASIQVIHPLIDMSLAWHLFDPNSICNTGVMLVNLTLYKSQGILHRLMDIDKEYHNQVKESLSISIED